MSIKLEYIWLDGSEPQQLRSKTKILEKCPILQLSKDYPMWSFDGSSTLQAESGRGKNTDCLLKPVFITKDPFRGDPHRLVFCEVLNSDKTPHITNHRHKLEKKMNQLGLTETIDKNEQTWFGWEQEYTLTHKTGNPFVEGEGLPLGFTKDILRAEIGTSLNPRPQGDYYCGVGADTVPLKVGLLIFAFVKIDVFTNAVVATCVLFVPVIGVGADTVPVNVGFEIVGLAVFAFRFNPD